VILVISDNTYKKALLIRRTEDTFLDLFSQGKLNGTVHTCSGQEFSALAFCSVLNKEDVIQSNHRCHGHYIARTGDVKGLIAELMGKASGVCGGIGSSQHLCNNNFYSNGVQGGIVPVAAGMALAAKRDGKGAIVVVFIGDGTLGEGVVYESMNLASLLQLPLHIVCENNRYAQSTKSSENLSGSILARPESFGIQTFHSNTWDLEELFKNAKSSIKATRSIQPVFHLVDTYRLNHHSKSDDKRDPEEVKKFFEKDSLTLFKNESSEKYATMLAEIDSQISVFIEKIEKEDELDQKLYINSQENDKQIEYKQLESIHERVVSRINTFFDETIEKDKKVIFIGEDVLSPYDGTFKVSAGLSTKYPDNVISTPISEAAITGLSNGLALRGYKPYLEIMFGDFVTLALDQIINHASKFHHMYNKQVNSPIVIRTPMGGGRGYGPTHSQTLDKFLVGIDNVTVIAINSLIDPKLLYEKIYTNENHPVIVIENKINYGMLVGSTKLDHYSAKYSKDQYPVIKYSPIVDRPNLTIVTYGGIAQDVIDSIFEIFRKLDAITEVIVLTKISPLDITHVVESVSITKRIIVIEEGNKEFGVGAEIISQVVENLGPKIDVAKRIGALSVPIPSVKSLENHVLPNTTIVEDIAKELH
jgi:2-oxoisovalerate dehydrogenase E1 component